MQRWGGGGAAWLFRFYSGMHFLYLFRMETAHTPNIRLKFHETPFHSVKSSSWEICVGYHGTSGSSGGRVGLLKKKIVFVNTHRASVAKVDSKIVELG